MEYTTLGGTGLTVSRICVGCMSFGRSREWFLDEEASAEIVERAIDLGINFFDTANSYSAGDSERFVGAALDGYDEDRLVLATKVGHGVGDPPPNGKGLSRKAIDHQLEGSLRRLKVDSIDLYQAQSWDFGTPIEETLRALTDAVRCGDVRYLGVSKVWAHQLASALRASDDLGAERIASVQNLYNLVYREDEKEVLPLAQLEGIGVTPFSPLMRGYLGRSDDDMEATTRGTADSERRDRWSPDAASTAAVKAHAEELAADHGVSVAQIVLAWLFHQPAVDAPIVGVTSVEHLEQAVEALDVSLSDSELTYLEAPYEPVQIPYYRGMRTP